MNKRYYVTGIPGTGKTTITEELIKRGVYAIDQDSSEYGLCVWMHNETKEESVFEKGVGKGKEFLEANDWYCDIEKLKKLLNFAPEVTFVCGITANQNEYLNLFDKVFLLQCSEETFINRVDTRITNNFGKHPDEKEHILSWYKEFEDDLINRRAIVINSEEPVSVVVDKILSKV